MLENCRICKVLINALIEDKNFLPNVPEEGRGGGQRLFNNVKKVQNWYFGASLTKVVGVTACLLRFILTLLSDVFTPNVPTQTVMRNDQVRAHGQWGETKRCLPLKIR